MRSRSCSCSQVISDEGIRVLRWGYCRDAGSLAAEAIALEPRLLVLSSKVNVINWSSRQKKVDPSKELVHSSKMLVNSSKLVKSTIILVNSSTDSCWVVKCHAHALLRCSRGVWSKRPNIKRPIYQDGQSQKRPPYQDGQRIKRPPTKTANYTICSFFVEYMLSHLSSSNLYIYI